MDAPLPTCAAEILKAAGNALTEDEIIEIAERIQKRRAGMIAEGRVADLEGEISRFAESEGFRLQAEAAIKKRNAQLQIIRRDQASRILDEHIKANLSRKPHKRFVAAMLALFEGTTRNVDNGRVSTNARRLAHEQEFLGPLMARLDRDVPTWHALLKDREFADNVTREMIEPGSTKDPDAASIARAMADAAEGSRRTLNNLGAAIGKLEGWAGPQIHDAAKLLRVSAREWVREILPRLDLERSFPGLDEKEVVAVLEDIHRTITMGRDAAGDAVESGGAVKSGNPAKSLGAERVLHFKSADDWIAYRDLFGSGNVVTAIFQHLQRAARVAAQMEAFGPSPEATIRKLASDLQSRIRGGEFSDFLSPAEENKAIESLSMDRQKVNLGIQAAVTEMQGLTLGGSHNLLATIAGGARTWQSLSKLSSAVLSSLSDLATAAANLKYQGQPMGNVWAEQFQQMLRGRTPADQREIAFLLGESFDGIIDNLTASVYAADAAPGMMSRGLTYMFKISGLTGWTDRVRGISARLHSAYMGSLVEKGWADLPPAYTRVLVQHGIKESQWEALRQATFRSVRDKTYVTPEAIDQLSDDIIRPLAGADNKTAIARARQDLKMSLRRFFADELNFGVIEADDATRRYLLQGTQRGTIPGEVLRMMAQFKSFPTAFTHRVLGRAIYGFRGASAAEQAGHIGHLMATLFVCGTASLIAKDYRDGYGMRDWSKPENVLAAMAQSGGAGIYGDFLFGQVSRFGNKPLETIAGPVAGSAASALDLLLKARDVAFHGGEGADKLPGDALNYALQNTPFLNLWYAKPILNGLFINSLKEMASPGFLARERQRRKKEQGQARAYPQVFFGR